MDGILKCHLSDESSSAVLSLLVRVCIFFVFTKLSNLVFFLILMFGVQGLIPAISHRRSTSTIHVRITYLLIKFALGVEVLKCFEILFKYCDVRLEEGLSKGLQYKQK